MKFKKNDIVAVTFMGIVENTEDSDMLLEYNTECGQVIRVMENTGTYIVQFDHLQHEHLWMNMEMKESHLSKPCQTEEAESHASSLYWPDDEETLAREHMAGM
jgi:hypothetical protein